MTCETAVLALRPAREDERDRGAGHQLGDVEAAHQVEADFGQADPGGQAVELAQAALGVRRSERGGDAVHRRRLGQPGQLGEHLERDGVGAAAVGVDGEHRDVLVHRQPPLVHLVQVRPVQHRAELVALDPGQGLVVADPQVDHPGVAQHRPAPRVLHGAAAQRDHRVRPADQAGHGFVLELAEVRLALGAEDLADVAAEALFDQHVAVHEGLAEPFGHDVPHRGLAGPHEADQHHHHRVLLRVKRATKGMLPSAAGRSRMPE